MSLELASGADVVKNGRSHFIHTRVSKGEITAIESAAKEADMSVSAFFRSLVLEGAGVQPVLSREDRLVFAAMLEDMRMIGVNLNQVARSLNSKKSVHPDEIKLVVSDVQRMQVMVLSELRRLTKQASYRRRGVDLS